MPVAELEAQLQALKQPAPGAAALPEAKPRVEKTERSKFPTVLLSGFVHLDADYFHQDPWSCALVGDIQDGVGFRRARLQALGNVAEFTAYSIEMDFASAGRPSVAK